MIEKKLFNLLKGHKKHIFYITIYNIAEFILNIIISAVFCYILYLAYNNNLAIKLLILLFVLLVAISILRIIFSRLSQKHKNFISDYIKISLRDKCFIKILNSGLNYKESKSKLMQLSIEGVEQLDTYFTVYLPQFFYAMISPLLLFIVCFFIEYKTALVLLFCLPLIPIAIMLVKIKAKNVFKLYWGKYESMGNTFLDYLQGMKEIKIFSDEKNKQKEIFLSSEEFRKITMKVLVMQLSSITIMDLVAFGGAALAIIVTLYSANLSQISAFSALFLILISAEFFIPMRSLGSAFHVGMNGLSSGNNIINFLDSNTLEQGDTVINKINSVKLKNVSFSYDKNTPVLKDINMSFSKGLFSIVGKSGCGKSTIINLITRGNDLNTGEILINDLNIKTINLKSYYKRIGVITCNDYIFNDTIRNNFLLAKSNASDQEIYSALDKVNLKGFVKSIGGLDYVVLEDSENISGGQKQRLSLAINLLVPKDLYVFDETTSNIDVDSEKIILHNIKKIAKEKIVILISHRLHNVINSNKIYYLENSNLVEAGNHLTLMKTKKLYYKLYNNQENLELGYQATNNA